MKCPACYTELDAEHRRPHLKVLVCPRMMPDVWIWAGQLIVPPHLETAAVDVMSGPTDNHPVMEGRDP
jgi:hypothetical protein